MDDFEFRDLDYEIKEDVWNSVRAGTYDLSWTQVRQVLPLFAKAGSVLSRQVNAYQLNEKNEAPLGMEELAIQLEAYDVLSTVLDVNDAVASIGHVDLMHCGLVRLKRLLVVGAFGNHIEFDPEQNLPQVAMSLESSDDSEFAVLRPRLLNPCGCPNLVDGADETAQPGRAGYAVSPVSFSFYPTISSGLWKCFLPMGSPPVNFVWPTTFAWVVSKRVACCGTQHQGLRLNLVPRLIWVMLMPTGC